VFRKLKHYGLAMHVTEHITTPHSQAVIKHCHFWDRTKEKWSQRKHCLKMCVLRKLQKKT